MRPPSSRKATSPPKGWLNKLMMVLLHTPGLHRIIGRSVALITFEGRRTGRTYTTPVSYSRQDDTVVVLSRASRVWWRNLTADSPVSLRMAGRVVSGQAQAHRASEADLATLVDFFEHRKMDAKAYGLSLRQDGRPSEADVRALLSNIVVIRIELTDPSRRPDEEANARRNGP